MKKLTTVSMVLVFIGFSFGQSTAKTEVAKIQTSAECGQCKTRLEEKLNYTAGVKFAELNLENKVLEVKFNPKKISLDEIRTIISETGYAADDVKAVPAAVDKLPMCCKPGGMKGK